MHGWQAGFLGMAMAAAISGNCTVIALGQFSLFSVGMLAAQIFAVQANRPWLAGIFWAFAMIKPQIALPFGLLFLIQRQWTGILSAGILSSGKPRIQKSGALPACLRRADDLGGFSFSAI